MPLVQPSQMPKNMGIIPTSTGGKFTENWIWAISGKFERKKSSSASVKETPRLQFAYSLIKTSAIIRVHYSIKKSNMYV